MPGNRSPIGMTPIISGTRPIRNSAGPDKKGVVRSIRGGSSHSPVSDITTGARGRGEFALQTHGTGFRCARGDDDEGKEKSRAASQ
jgi:formylglycine-generating enzyme required for sulfatase activity